MRGQEEGFGLVEIMVGLGIGMLAMIVVMQVFSQSEAQKRSATSGADAQTNGAVALSMIERDMRNAGWGMSIAQYAGCTETYSYCDNNSPACGGKTGDIGFAPAAVIVAEGGAKPDAVTIQYFADPNLGSFSLPSNTVVRKDMPQPSSELDVGSTQGCAIGSLMLVAQNGKCTLMQVTQVQDQALKIQHNPGASGPYNPSANYQDSNGWPAYTVGATLSCFAAAPDGPLFKRSYSIDSALRQLLRSDNATATAAKGDVASPEIVDLQAQYGIATGADSQKVTQWVDASGAWAKPAAADRVHIKAVRLALVARSAQYEKPAPGAECATTTDDDVKKKWPDWATYSTASYPADWKCYRYKVYETIVPLRNVLWGGV